LLQITTIDTAASVRPPTIRQTMHQGNCQTQDVMSRLRRLPATSRSSSCLRCLWRAHTAAVAGGSILSATDTCRYWVKFRRQVGQRLTGPDRRGIAQDRKGGNRIDSRAIRANHGRARKRRCCDPRGHLRALPVGQGFPSSSEGMPSSPCGRLWHCCLA